MIDNPDINTYFLQPTLLFASNKTTMIQTILGSCVSVCLWDKKLHIGGMNHYMLPFWNGTGLATPKFGNIAIEKLIDKMLSLGCKKKDLVAKIFGGGKIINTLENKRFQIGTQNVLVAQEMLRNEKIPILVENTGGTSGRKIRFNTNTGVVLHKFIEKASNNLFNNP
jgi:chemotaxis protein CheD